MTNKLPPVGHAGHDPEPPATGETLSMNFGSWQPTRPGECSIEDHNKYSLVNPDDNKRYHTWHPPVCPDNGCFYGHDHGMNPATSPLEEVFGPIMFGIPNDRGMEMGLMMDHTTVDPVTGIVRKEDNVGQKCLHGHREFRDIKDATNVITGDARTVFHMGTHSRDAATNNIHAFIYQLLLSNGHKFNVSFLAAIGKPGFFHSSCKGTEHDMGPYAPANSPTKVNPLNSGNSFGTRNIVESACIEGLASHVPSKQYHELWRTVVVVNSPVPTIKTSTYTNPNTKIVNPNSAALQVNWYWNTSFPARYFDAATQSMRYTIDTCRVKNADGTYLVKSGLAVYIRKIEAELGYQITWDHPLSPFRGDGYAIRLTGFTFKNGPSPTKAAVWYTDKEGLNPSLTPFAGSLKWEGQPTDWYVNALGQDARMVPYKGGIKVHVSAVTMNTFLQTDEPLSYQLVTADERAKGFNPFQVHAPN